MKNFLIAIAIIISLPAFAQHKLNPELLKKAKYLKTEYPDDAGILLESVTEYSFEVNRKTRKVEVIIDHYYEIMSLKSGNRLGVSVSYDENSEVETKSIGGSLKKDKNTNLCGNVEVNGIFYSDAKQCVYADYFDNIAQSRELEIRKTIYDAKYLVSAYFHEHYPVQNRKIIINKPEDIELDIIEFHFDTYGINKQNTSEQTIYMVKNLDKADLSNGEPGPSHFMPHLLFIVRSYELDGSKNNYLNTVDDLYGWYSSLVDDVDNDQSAFKETVDKLTSSYTKEEQIENIYYWVQDNIRYIAFEDGIAGFKPATAQDVYTKLYGDCKGMANLTANMLRMAGFDARLCWIGTSRLAYDYSYPSLGVDNHMVTGLYYRDSLYILDPTESYIAFGELAARIQGQQTLIEDGDSYKVITLPESKIADNTVEHTISISIEGDQLVGTDHIRLTGESKRRILYMLNHVETPDKEDVLRDILSMGEKSFVIEEYSYSSADNRKDDFIIDLKFRIDNAVMSFGDEYYIDFDIYKRFSNYSFEEDRTTPYDFKSKKLRKMNMSITIPEGFKVDSKPEDLKLDNGYYSADLKIVLKDNKLNYSSSIEIKKHILPSSALTEWNSFIESLNSFYDDQIVLTK